MWHPLTPHPADPPLPAESVRALSAWDGRQLALGFELIGALDRLVLPEPGPIERADELWRSTCFEAFVGWKGGGYKEINLAPDRRWATYRFTGYREGMEPARARPLAIEVEREGGRFELTALVELPELPDVSDLRLALAAVIAGQDGGRSHWALAHPADVPDFHRREGFAIHLTAGQGSW